MPVLTLPPRRRYTPFLSGDFRMEMGLHALDLADWIEVDQDLPAHLAAALTGVTPDQTAETLTALDKVVRAMQAVNVGLDLRFP